MRVQFGLCSSSRILSPLLRQECITGYVTVSEDSSRLKRREIPAAEACDTYNSELTMSEFYTNKGYVSETWWKDYFMTAKNRAEIN